MFDDQEENISDTQSGVSICTINVNGFSSNHERGIDKRLTLASWLKQNEIDICCGQEWYKFKSNEHNAYTKGLSSEQFNPDYCLHYSNSKTFILYKSNIKFTELNYNLKTNGIDITWGIIENESFYMAIASVYHSPSYEASWDGIESHINEIKKQYKSKPIYFSINGDVNAKHQFWSNKTDKRGEQIVEFMDQNNLSVHHKHGMITHQNLSNGKMDAIDITIVSDNIKQYISDWYTNIDLVIKEFNKQSFSDHLCVVIKFNFKIQLDNNFKYTWRFNPKRDDLYCKLIKNGMEEWFKYYLIHRNDVSQLDNLVLLFELNIRKAATKAYGIKIYNKNNKKLISIKEKKLKRKYRKIEKRYKRLLKKYDKQNKEIKILKKQLNKINHLIKIERIRNINYEIETREQRINDASIDNTKEFYRLYKNAANNSNTKIGPIYDKINGNIIASTKDEIANQLLNHFNKPLIENKYNEKAIKNHKIVETFMSNYKINRNKSNISYNKPFTNFEVMRLINTLNLNSAMGYDMIHYKLLHIPRFEIVTYLTALYNLSFYIHRKIPTCWRYSNITPIPKPGKKPIIEKNIRPISVAPANLRNIEKLNSNRLIYEMINNRIKLKPGNNAFQPNKSTDDNLINITENIYRAMENKSFIEMVFMDIKSAYDSIWIDGFIYKLINFNNMDGNIIAWYMDYLNKRYNRVIYNGYKTDWILSRKCFPQGGPSMPPFFNIFINDYNAIEKIIDINNFADDTSIFNESEENMSITYTTNDNINIRKSLQNEIDNFYQWSLNWKLIISDTKCKTITFSNKSKFNAYVYTVNGKKIDLIHHAHHAPPKCKHNKIYSYHAWDIDKSSNLGYISNDSNLSENINNYDNNNNKINRSGIEWNNYRINTNQMSDMVESERFLGLYFDPKLTWKSHLKQIKDRVEIKLHQLRKIAYSDTYNLSTYSIWRLYLTVIRPIIEYGLVVYGNDNIIEELEKLQYKAARIALKLKRTTPRKILGELLNITTIKERLEILQIKLWHRYRRAPDNHLSNKIFNKWYNYIYNNNKDKIIEYKLRNNNKPNYNQINLNNFNQIKQSPLTRAFTTMKRLKGEFVLEQKRSITTNKSPPCYTVNFPNNIYTNIMPTKPINDAFIFYTDGSMTQNPGAGGCAYWSPNFPISTKMHPIMHDTTINYCELYSFKLIFETILYIYQNTNIVEKNINIYTDSLFCINLFSIDGYAKYQYYYELLNEIFIIIDKLNKIINIKIEINKVKSHSGILGNEVVDNIAKRAASIAEICREERFDEKKAYPTLKYSTYNNPILVDNRLMINKIKKYNKINKENLWNDYFINPSNNGSKFIGNAEFIHGFPKNNAFMPIYTNQSKHYIDEQKILNPKKMCIINKLRSEHINLNNYLHFHFKKEYTNNKCIHCNCIESVKHYLTECKLFDNQRKKLYRSLRKIDVNYKFKHKINTRLLLFPFLYQDWSNKDEIDYNIINENNTFKRVHIYNAICKYVKRTNRFNGKYGI